MYQFIVFLTKLPTLTTEEFITYYEDHHLPLVTSLQKDAVPKSYTRRYLRDPLPGATGLSPPMPFDVVTEFMFENKQAFEAWMFNVSEGGKLEKLGADEEKFLDRKETKAYEFELRGK